MKRLLLLISLFCCSQAWAAVAHVTTTNGVGNCTSSVHSGNIGANCSTGTITFSFTATNTGDLVMFGVLCDCASTTNSITLAASGWSVNTLACTGATSCTTGTFGTSTNRMVGFWAYAPNTSAATFTITLGTTTNFTSDLLDEFSGMDAGAPIDANVAKAASGTPTTTVTPNVNGDGLWGACADSITAVGTNFTKSQDDAQQDWSEYRILTTGSGVGQTVNFTGSGTYELLAVAIKPAGGAASPTAMPVIF